MEGHSMRSLWYTAFGYDEGIAGGTGCTWRRGLQWASPVVTVKAEGKVSICAPLTVSGEGLQLYQPLFGTANKPYPEKIPSRARQKEGELSHHKLKNAVYKRRDIWFIIIRKQCKKNNTSKSHWFQYGSGCRSRSLMIKKWKKYRYSWKK